jgi:hypothetical protein
MLAVAQRRNSADAHQPDQQQPRDFFRPGKRLSKHVPAHDLEADDGGLPHDEDRDGPLECEVRA